MLGKGLDDQQIERLYFLVLPLDSQLELIPELILGSKIICHRQTEKANDLEQQN